MRQFLESTVVNGKVVKDLMDADVRDPSWLASVVQNVFWIGSSNSDYRLKPR